jgi:hypothetical protein
VALHSAPAGSTLLKKKSNKNLRRYPYYTDFGLFIINLKMRSYRIFMRQIYENSCYMNIYYTDFELFVINNLILIIRVIIEGTGQLFSCLYICTHLLINNMYNIYIYVYTYICICRYVLSPFQE